VGLRQIFRNWLGLEAWPQFWPCNSDGDCFAVNGANWKGARALAAVERSASLYAYGLLLPRSIVDSPPGGGSVVVTSTDAAHALAAVSEDDLLIAGYCAALIGSGYLKILRNDRQGIAGLSYIAPWRVTYERTTDGARRVYARIAANEGMGETEELIAESDLVTFKWRPNPENPLLGESPLAAIAPAIANALTLRDTQGRMLRNASFPLTILTTAGKLSDETMSRIRTNWDQNFARGNQGRTAILGDGFEADTLDLAKCIDLQLVEGFNAHVREIGRAWGVPVTLLNETAELSYNSAIEASRTFVLHSLRPWLARIEGELNRKLLTAEERAAGRRVRFDDSRLMLAPGTETSEFLSRMVSAGIMTPDEARNRIGLGDIEGGALLRVPVNLAPATNDDGNVVGGTARANGTGARAS
jgi:HK97 family phage portal protein